MLGAAFVSGQPGGGPSAGVSDRWPGGGARQGPQAVVV